MILNHYLPSRLHRFRLLIETAILTLLILCLKLTVEFFGLEFFQLSALFTSLIGGVIFIVSILLAGTLADYKESEKLPAEIATALENIYEDGVYSHRLNRRIRLPALVQTLKDIISRFYEDLGNQQSRRALESISGLSESFLAMEKLGIPPNYIVRLKQEQSNLRKSVLRIYYVQRIQFIPSAHILLVTMIVLVLALLTFTKVEPARDSLILVGFIAFLFIYLIRLITTIDTPFRLDGYTKDDVSLFLLREFRSRLDKPRRDSVH